MWLQQRVETIIAVNQVTKWLGQIFTTISGSIWEQLFWTLPEIWAKHCPQSLQCCSTGCYISDG